MERATMNDKNCKRRIKGRNDLCAPSNDSCELQWHCKTKDWPGGDGLDCSRQGIVFVFVVL